MKEFDLNSLHDITDRMYALEVSFDAQRELGEIAGKTDSDTALSVMTESERYCEQEGFDDALEVIQRVIFGFDYNTRDFSTMAAEMRHVRDSLFDECRKRNFVAIAPDLISYVNNSEWIGAGVAHFFPSAGLDIQEAGNCLAMGFNTAAVFHMMRAVEWGLRSLCAHLGLRRAERRTKNGKKKYTPIPYVYWEAMLNRLPDLVDARVEKLKRGKAKQEAQEFYYPVLQDIRGIRDAWRNHVMHTRASYNRKDAEAIASHVQRLMMLLTSRIEEP